MFYDFQWFLSLIPLLNRYHTNTYSIRVKATIAPNDIYGLTVETPIKPNLTKSTI